jgi:hypothetical protein
MGLLVAVPQAMAPEQVHGSRYALNDGLGERWVVMQPHGQVEVLTLAPTLASHAAVEPAIRARAERMAFIEAPAVAVVRRVERDAAGVRIVADAANGIRLSDVLVQLESNPAALPHAAMLELASSVVHALAELHRLSNGLVHGAVTPAHIVLRRDGSAVLTDSVFGAALESLEWNREQLWREFHVALPAAASLPRFDQRADVTQLGAVVLAIALRRPLRGDEYPRCAGDQVIAASSDTAAPGASAFRMWLQQTLQLQPRSMFASAVEAKRVFADILAAPEMRRAGPKALAALLEPARMLIA